MIEVIGISAEIPVELRERVKMFNRALIAKYAPWVLDFYTDLAGCKLVRLYVENPTADEQHEFLDLVEQRERSLLAVDEP